MIVGALVCGLVAMVGYGLANTYALSPAKRFGPARFLLLRGLAVCAILLLASLPTLYKLQNWRAAVAAVAIGVFGYVPPLALTHGIKVSRVSIVVAIASTSPFITVLLSAGVLGVQLHALQWVGVMVIIAANVAISLNFRSLRESNIFKLASGIPFGLIAAVGWGVVYFAIIYPTRSLGPWLSALLMEVGVTLAAAVHVWRRRESFMPTKAFHKPIVLNALLIIAGTLGYTVGVHSFNVGLVAALANSMAVVSIISAALVHHERLSRTEKVLAAIMAAGVVIVSL